MQYRQLGQSGLVVSRLAFGAMTFGQGHLVGELKNNIDQKQANEMVKMALDAGINFFDTADMYTNGQSEIMLGKALEGKRQQQIIATKCGFRSDSALTEVGLSYRYILQCVQNSLKRLNTDYIDLFFLHIPDPITPLEETARALEDVVSKGYVRYSGFSNFAAWRGQKLLGIQENQKFSPSIAAQMYYSLLGRDLEQTFVLFLQANHVGLIVWSPLASGFLSGKYSKANPVPEDSRRAKFNFPPIDLETGYEVIEQLKQLAAKYQASIAQIAIAWLLAKNYVSSVLIGANTLTQLTHNLGAAQIKLTKSDVDLLDAISEIPKLYPYWMEPMGCDASLMAALQA